MESLPYNALLFAQKFCDSTSLYSEMGHSFGTVDISRLALLCVEVEAERTEMDFGAGIGLRWRCG